MVTLNTNSILAPGTVVSENVAGFIPVELASFATTYMLGVGTTGPKNTPTQVISVEDFTNQFGSSSSLTSVKLYFANNPNGVLYFVNCLSPQIFEVTIGTVAAGTWGLTINGTAISVNYVDASPTDPELVTVLMAAIATNSTVNQLVEVLDGSIGDAKFRIRGLSPTTTVTITLPTAPVGSTLTVSADLATGNTALDALYAIEKAFDEEMAQGFLIAPEFFAVLTSQSDRTSLAVAMENLAGKEGYDWMALVDCGPTASIASAAAFVTEGQLYTTARGHLAYFAPFVVDLEDNEVPPSAAIAGLAIRRYRSEGFQEPPAGARFPILGVKNVKVKLTKAHQEVANPLGINYIRNLPNKGVVAWGSRTRSSSPYYRFVNTRIILNVLSGTLKNAFDTLIFTAVDGRGVLFTRIKETIEQICYRLWIGNALYGANPRDAYAVVCGAENNPALDLEAGVVRADVYVAPVPTMERLLISLIRTPIGQVQTVVQNAVGG